MNPDINEHLLKVSAGYIILITPLQIGTDVTINLQGTVTQITDKDNQDGTVNRVYTVKGVLATVHNEDNQIIGIE